MISESTVPVFALESQKGAFRHGNYGIHFPGYKASASVPVSNIHFKPHICCVMELWLVNQYTTTSY